MRFIVSILLTVVTVVLCTPVDQPNNAINGITDNRENFTGERQLPKVKQYITTHDLKTGKSLFSNALPELLNTSSAPDDSMPMTHLYATTGLPINLAQDADITFDAQYRKKSSGLVNTDGALIRIVDFAPGKQLPGILHRTQSLDYGVVLEGQLELILDSKERRLMRQGDIAVQRGTMHAWRNPTDQWSRILFVLQVSRPVEIDGRTLGDEVGGLVY